MSTLIPGADGHEHWLLGLASRVPATVEWLLPEVNFDALNVTRVEGLTSKHCADLLLKLEDAGAIRVIEADLVLTATDLALAVDNLLNGARRRLDYDLTELGGRLWEDAERPDWSRFVQVYSISPPGGELAMSGVLAGINWDVVVAYLGHYGCLRHENCTGLFAL